MGDAAKIVAAGHFDEMWGASFREQGFQYEQVKGLKELGASSGDCFIIDSREQTPESFSKVSVPSEKPFLSLVSDDVDRSLLEKLKEVGSLGYVRENMPPQELGFRIKALLKDGQKAKDVESRASNRIWYQTEVEYEVFDKKYKAWSTTLSETGIFLRTDASFPLYSVIRLRFNLLGENKIFESSGVIVREEVEGDVRGFGVMFQNLKGDSVRILESFLELYQ